VSDRDPRPGEGPHGHGPYSTELAAHRDALTMLLQDRQMTTLAIAETRRRIRACLK